MISIVGKTEKVIHRVDRDDNTPYETIFTADEVTPICGKQLTGYFVRQFRSRGQRTCPDCLNEEDTRYYREKLGGQRDE